MITIQDVKDAVEKIRLVSADDEVAHSMEDDLYQEFIEFVATSTIEPYAEMARILLTTKDIEFARWCA